MVGTYGTVGTVVAKIYPPRWADMDLNRDLQSQ